MRGVGMRRTACLTLLAFTWAGACPRPAWAEQQYRTKVYFYHPDHLGSTNLVTDETGQVVQRIDYTPHGQPYRMTGQDVTSRKFTGKQLDPTTMLYYYGARYYDPQLGRFIQPDSIVQAPADPQTLNRYTYARNNPLIYTDPTGHSFWKKAAGFFKAAASTLLQAGALIAAPFSGGASAFFLTAGTILGGAQAAADGRFGSWAAGFGISMAAGSFIPSPNFTHLGYRMTAGALLGAATGAISGGIASVIEGGSFGSGARAGAIGGAAGGAANSFLTSQQFKNWQRDGTFMSDRAQLAAWQQAAEQHALNVNTGDKIPVIVGARPLGFPSTAGGKRGGPMHRYLRWQSGGFDMGPEGGAITTGISSRDSWTATEAYRAVRPDLVRETTVTVSKSGLEAAVATYNETWAGQTYNWGSYNSNYAVDSIVYSAGGEAQNNPGWAPEFTD